MDIKKSVDLFESYLELDRKAVGIKFFFNEDDFDKFPIYQRSHKLTYCNAVQLASKGKSMKLTGENQACPNGAMALNFIDVAEEILNGKARFSNSLYKSIEIGKSINDDMEFIKERLYGVALMPLENYLESPDIVIVVSKSYNIMRIIQGHGYFNGYTNNLKTVGLQAVCQDLTTYPYNTSDINISLLCPGTRLVADWQMDEIGIGIPFKRWNEIIEGLIATTNSFERDPNKKLIIEKLEKRALESKNIKLGENYDDASYSGGKINL